MLRLWGVRDRDLWGGDLGDGFAGGGGGGREGCEGETHYGGGAGGGSGFLFVWGRCLELSRFGKVSVWHASGSLTRWEATSSTHECNLAIRRVTILSKVDLYRGG